ncbi:MAG TPA: hypothetical protein VN647_03180 [Nitrospira sp.]|nr:hypothetical protein [Nitrospira sp.]
MSLFHMKIQAILDVISVYEEEGQHERLDADHMLYLLVEDFRKSLPGQRIPTAGRTLWYSVLGNSRDCPEDVATPLSQFADWLIQNYLTERELVIHIRSGSLEFYGNSYSNIDPNTLALLEFLQQHPGEKFSSSDLARKIPGLRGNPSMIRNLLKELEKIEPRLRACVKGKTGAGRWLEVPRRHYT